MLPDLFYVHECVLWNYYSFMEMTFSHDTVHRSIRDSG